MLGSSALESKLMLNTSCNCWNWDMHAISGALVCFGSCSPNNNARKSLLQSHFGTSGFLTHRVTGPAREVTSCAGCKAVSDWLRVSLIVLTWGRNVCKHTNAHTVWRVKVSAYCATSTTSYIRLWSRLTAFWHPFDTRNWKALVLMRATFAWKTVMAQQKERFVGHLLLRVKLR